VQQAGQLALRTFIMSLTRSIFFEPCAALKVTDKLLRQKGQGKAGAPRGCADNVQEVVKYGIDTCNSPLTVQKQPSRYQASSLHSFFGPESPLPDWGGASSSASLNAFKA
jgi:hypothetical protein